MPEVAQVDFLPDPVIIHVRKSACIGPDPTRANYFGDLAERDEVGFVELLAVEGTTKEISARDVRDEYLWVSVSAISFFKPEIAARSYCHPAGFPDNRYDHRFRFVAPEHVSA